MVGRSALRVGTGNVSWDMLGEGVVAAWGVCARVTEPPVTKRTQMSPPQLRLIGG